MRVFQSEEMVVIEVSDKGIGLSEGRLARLGYLSSRTLAPCVEAKRD